MPFFVGHMVPREERHGMNYIKLLELMTLAMAHRHSKETAQYLALVAAEYLEEFYALCPDVAQRPKQHYTVHFTSLIVKCVVLGNVYLLTFYDVFRELP